MRMATIFETDERAVKNQYSTDSVHVSELIQKDQVHTRLRDLLLEGARSSPSGPADDEYFEALRAVVRNRLMTQPSRFQDIEA